MATDFGQEVRQNIAGMAADERFQALTREWFDASTRHRYSYNFRWMGQPIIQYPQDIVATQEVLWEVQPDCVIETGIAHGGSLLLTASILHAMGGPRFVVGIDIEIRPHNRAALERHVLRDRIRLIQGSSVDPAVVATVQQMVGQAERVVVMLDSNHTHDHVLAELRAYSPLVKKDGQLIVFDTAIEQMVGASWRGRDWSVGNNPWTAVQAFLRENDRFIVDTERSTKLGPTVAPGGYLRCVK